MTLNEKYFPKRSRYVITNKLVEAIMNVSANFYAANSIFPNKEEKLQKKCEKPTPLGVGWIAQNKKIMCM